MELATITTNLHSENRLTLHVEVQGVAETSVDIVGARNSRLELLLSNRDCVLSGIQRDSRISKVDHGCTACIPYCLRNQGQYVILFVSLCLTLAYVRFLFLFGRLPDEINEVDKG